jgi:GR25 family glycosyltransferase involved in LPS biosynthesis
MKSENNMIQTSVRAYLINLDSRTDRLTETAPQLQQLALDFTRVSAIKASEITAANNMLSAAQYACWQSHLQAMKQIVASGTPFGIISEDDIQIIDYKRLQKLLNSPILNRIDLLQIGWIRSGFKERLMIKLINLESSLFTLIAILGKLSPFIQYKYGSRLRVLRAGYVSSFKFICDDFKSGGHFYLISRKLCLEILSLNMVPMIPIDTFFATLALNHKYRIYRLRSSLVAQSNSPSSIKGG